MTSQGSQGHQTPQIIAKMANFYAFRGCIAIFMMLMVNNHNMLNLQHFHI